MITRTKPSVMILLLLTKRQMTSVLPRFLPHPLRHPLPFPIIPPPIIMTMVLRLPPTRMLGATACSTRRIFLPLHLLLLRGPASTGLNLNDIKISSADLPPPPPPPPPSFAILLKLVYDSVAPLLPPIQDSGQGFSGIPGRTLPRFFQDLLTVSSVQ